MFSLEWPFVRDLINHIKLVHPDVVIVAGGEHVTALPEFSLRDCGNIDFIVRGEGELAFASLLECLENSSAPDKLAGLSYLQQNRYVETLPVRRERVLDTFYEPAWDLVPLEDYLSGKIMTGVDLGRSLPMIASRGCPYQCTFCSNPQMWGTLWRARSPAAVVDEMERYVDLYDIENFDFHDLTAIVKRSWIIEFCQLLIERELNITWQLPSGTRSEAIDAEVCELLARTGCAYMNYAPESGSERTLERIKKKIDKQRMLDSMRNAVEKCICVKANFILGFPHETLKDVVQTYWFAIKMSWLGIHDASFFPFSPYPGSQLFRDVLARGEITLDDEYFYSLSQYTDPRYAKSYAPKFSKNRLRLLCLLGMALFYSVNYLRRPGRFLSLLNQLKTDSGTTKLSSSILRVLKKREQLEQTAK